MPPRTHEEYLASLTPPRRAATRRVIAAVRKLVPGAEPCIGYGIPAFRDGKIFLYCAAFRDHVGVFPPVEGPAVLLRALAPYRGPKGNLRLPYDAFPSPALLARLVKAMHARGAAAPARRPAKAKSRRTSRSQPKRASRTKRSS